MLCGFEKKESLKHAVFYLDLYTNRKSWAFQHNSSAWRNRRYYDAECTIISGIPYGQHVLTVSTGGMSDGIEYPAFISHLITY